MAAQRGRWTLGLPFLGDGWLVDVIGRPARSGGFLYVPVWMELATEARRHFLERWAGGAYAEDPGESDEGSYDALWVRARIARVFRFLPLSPIGWTGLLDVPFLAVRGAKGLPYLEAYPFVCTDFDRDTVAEDDEAVSDAPGLAFPREDGRSRTPRGPIADGFWRALSAEPDELAIFDDYHGLDDTWHRIGCDGRRLYRVFRGMADHSGFGPDDVCVVGPWEAQTYASHQAGFGPAETRTCPDCEGSGEEAVDHPADQDCLTCGGSGAVGW